jgi:hypothetical protein
MAVEQYRSTLPAKIPRLIQDGSGFLVRTANQNHWMLLCAYFVSVAARTYSQQLSWGIQEIGDGDGDGDGTAHWRWYQHVVFDMNKGALF